MPTERILREYQKRCPVNPGLNEQILILIRESFKNASISNKVVSLLFDEISFNPEIHYDKTADEFKGVVDDGVTRKPVEAKTALVAMITWPNIRLRQTVGYWFLGQKGNTEKIYNIVYDTIKKINESSLIVKSIICDQGPKNLRLLKKFEVTPKKPFFYVPDNPHKIFFCLIHLT